MNLSLAAAQRIETCDFSLLTDKTISVLNMHQNDCVTELLNDAGIIFACVWCCVKPQADKIGISEEEFTEGISGQTLIDGKEVWAEEMADFFPEMKTAISRLQKAQRKGLKKVQAKMDELSDKAVSRVNQELDQALNQAELEVTTGKTSG